MILAGLSSLDLPVEVVRLYVLTDEVVAAAEMVVRSYRATGGCTVPLSVNLRRLDGAVREWQQHLRALSLDSDVNGFDRSEGYSNGQTQTASSGEGNGGAQAPGERWAEGAPAAERKPPHRASAPTTAQPRSPGAS